MDLKKLLAQSIFWRGFYFFSVMLVNVFLSRYMQAAGAGNLYFITVIFSFMLVLASLGGDAGIIYFASGNLIEKNKLMSLAGVWSVSAGLIMMGVVYVYLLLHHSPGKTLYQWYFIYAFFHISGQSFANYSVAMYYTRENYFLPNFLLSIVNLVFIFFIPGKNGYTNATQLQWVTFFYFSTYFIAGLLVYLSYIIQYKKEGVFAFPSGEEFKKFFRYSRTALAANFVFFLVYKIDYFFVNYSPVCTPADLGNYIQVSKVGQMMLIVPQIIASVVFPRTASGIDQTSLSNSLMTIARLLSQLFLLVFIIVALVGHEFFTLIFGESFNEMQVPMLIIIPGIFSLSILALLSAHFAGKGLIKINLQAAIIGLTVMVVGDSIFVTRYGIVAAAIVSTISYTANLTYTMWHFYKGYSVHWKEFFKWRKTDYNWMLTLLKRNVG